MQFLLVKQNGPEKFREWEEDFRAIYAYLESLRAPKYPFDIDERLSEHGRAVFEQHCADCHGTYGGGGQYPERRIPIEEVGTDRTRLDALLPEYRKAYGASWFAREEELPTIEDPGGYVAPPLDGIWASAPYFHNGSVPTLAHVLNSTSRPTIWRRTEDGYDQQNVGLEIESIKALPPNLNRRERRHYFDTRVSGKSVTGHSFGDSLTDDERSAVVEYLKTL